MSKLAEIERLLEAATPGPWVAVHVRRNDRALLVALRNAAPALLRLWKAAKDTGGDFSHMCDNPDWPQHESPCPCGWCEMSAALRDLEGA